MKSSINVRTFEIDTEDGWKEIPIKMLKKGDVFHIKENGITLSSTYTAAGKAKKIKTDEQFPEDIKVYQGNLPV